jgi:transaldolase
MDRLHTLHQAGVSVWVDTLSRELLDSGDFSRLLRDRCVGGATSNPSAFAAAITTSESYDSQLADLVATGIRDPRQLFFALALEDVRRAADYLRPLYDATDGGEGFISFECTPELAHNTDGLIRQAMILWERIDRPNAMIEVPGTKAALEAVRFLTELGVNVNVTPLFSVERYAQVLAAYRSGLQARLSEGGPLDHIHSVASFFVGGIDAKCDALLPETSPLRGRIGISHATGALALHTEGLTVPAWQRLLQAGANPLRPLWACTGTTKRTHSDVRYVESLVAPGVVTAMSLATLEDFADHGRVTSEPRDWRAFAVTLVSAALAGLDQRQLATELESERLAALSSSFDEILDVIEKRVALLDGTLGQAQVS